MGPVYRFLATYEGIIYILLALGSLFAFRWLWKSWREWRDSVFGLEREFAVRRLSQAVTVSLLIIFLFIGELFLVSFLAPTLPASDILATPTIDILNQAEGALSASQSISLTAVAPAIGAEDTLSSGCVPDEIALTFPESGQEVSGTVTLVGTVNIDNFGFYKYEVAPQGTDTWTTISAGREMVQNGEIGFWDTSALTPGDYRIRLLVTNNQGQAVSSCVVPVRVTTPLTQ